MSWVKKVTVHWNAGTYKPNSVDRASYHGGTDGDGNFWLGDKPPEVNKTDMYGNLPPNYVRHTGAGNSNNIGHCINGMGGSEVSESPLNMGKYPIKMSQIDAAAVQIYENWLVPYELTAEDVETHAEFRKRTGRGNHKWDITCYEGMTQTVEPEVIGDMIRSKIRMVELQNTMASKPARERPSQTKTVKAANILQAANGVGFAAILSSFSDLDPAVAMVVIGAVAVVAGAGLYLYFNRRRDFKRGWR